MLNQLLAKARSAESRSDEGFTLIELLIVIVVLGILAGVVVFGVGTFRADSQVAACKANVKTVGIAADAYNAKTGLVATDVAQMVTLKYLKSAPPASDGITLVAGQVVTTGCP